jgi:radical SAM superfamily enzyme YgiQ (UPF0313 family)
MKLITATATGTPRATGNLREGGAVLLVSCYELGHQPLAIASALAVLKNAGFDPAVVDVSVDKLTPDLVSPARVAILSVPMHTALRLGMQAAEKIRALNPRCRTVFFGSYAALNSEILFETGADFILSGEFEEPLRRLLESLEAGEEPEPFVPTWLQKIEIPVPRRDTLPDLSRYAHLELDGETHIAGHTETSRGCRHLCRHCSLPPVYGGRFFIVPRDVVMQDIRNQVEQGARHITFGDPYFLNGPGHAIAIARALHEEFPRLTFDVTAKVEHLLQQQELLPEFARQGCLFIVSAVESLNDRVLEILDKGHTRKDVYRVLEITRAAGITLRPTWVAFTPWTSIDDYFDILNFIQGEDLIDHVDPVQLTLRLLVPPGSLLVNHPDMRPYLGELKHGEISYTWTHPDGRMDALQVEVSRIVQEMKDRVDTEIFHRIREAAARYRSATCVDELGPDRVHPEEIPDSGPSDLPFSPPRSNRRRAPRLTEPWFC